MSNPDLMPRVSYLPLPLPRDCPALKDRPLPECSAEQGHALRLVDPAAPNAAHERCIVCDECKMMCSSRDWAHCTACWRDYCSQCYAMLPNYDTSTLTIYDGVNTA